MNIIIIDLFSQFNWVILHLYLLYSIYIYINSMCVYYIQLGPINICKYYINYIELPS